MERNRSTGRNVLGSYAGLGGHSGQLDKPSLAGMANSEGRRCFAAATVEIAGLFHVKVSEYSVDSMEGNRG